MINKIALIVVLYNDYPKDYVYEDNGIRKIIVDNTPARELDISGENLIYIPLRDNYGIAKALNVGFQKAKEYDVEWVLTMDQDSLMPLNLIDEYIRFINEGHPSIGIIAPLINMYQGENKCISDSFEEINEALTSGSFINVKAYDAAGGFKEELFIDGVDFEFCWNIKSKGYKVYQLNRVLMQHQLGNTQEIKFLGYHLFYVTHHNYIRRYYMTRNGLYIRDLYGYMMPKSSSCSIAKWISLFKIIFFEKDSFRKLKARNLGVKDYKNNKFGKFDHTI